MTKTTPAQHSWRFRKVANAYARRVAHAYDLDIEAAAADDDATVATKVRDWEIAQGLTPIDWPAVGREEGRDGTDPSRIAHLPTASGAKH